MTPKLYRRKLKLREEVPSDQGHRAATWYNQVSDPLLGHQICALYYCDSPRPSQLCEEKIFVLKQETFLKLPARPL